MRALRNLITRFTAPTAAGNRPALFMHIRRTAGTSLVTLARYRYGQSMVTHGDWDGRPPSELAGVEFVAGHFGHDYAKTLMAGRYTFTFLRDPAARVLSMYRFCRKRDPEEFAIYRRARELDLVPFLEAGLTDSLVRQYLWNNEVWQLAAGYDYPASREIDAFSEADLLDLAKAHLEEFSFVGFTECFARDGGIIREALGLQAPGGLPAINSAEDDLGEAAKTPRVRQLLDDLTGLDRELYQYALRLYERRKSANLAQR